MQDHPLTPMGDPDIRRVLSSQSTVPVDHVPHQVVRLGSGAIAAALARFGDAPRLVIVDAISDDDLLAIGAAVGQAPLVTGGSGIALGLPANYRSAGLLVDKATAWEGVRGRAVALAGSVSSATRSQVTHHESAGYPVLRLEVDRIVNGGCDLEQLAEWVLGKDGVPLVTTTAEPEAVAAAQERHGREHVASSIEMLFAGLARILVARGVTRLISAGGETSGAVVGGLDVAAMTIGPEIDPGVPSLAVVGRPLALALKSGNFGAPDFFSKAAQALEGALHE